MMMTTDEIRTQFLEYFSAHQHHIVASSSLIPPKDDMSILFTNAGMVQFKQVFLGFEKRAYQCAASAQRCLRAGGKHNDLDNVGFTKRHHTFFEMMGNFSFGDYFKQKAIFYAWDFLTRVLKLPAEKLWVTVYVEDTEAESIWLNEIGVDPKRLSRCGKRDNFWSMGDTGPCGPCTEIFYDHGSDIPGGPPGSVNGDNDRYVEIWNIVFMQYNRDAAGEMIPLPQGCVDTGMGLERMAAVMQGTNDNYHNDVFSKLMQAVHKLLGQSDAYALHERVIADHIRSIFFLIVDGVIPSNDGRGYVLRRIIRRAVRYGYLAGKRKPFLSSLLEVVVEVMQAAYADLAQHTKMVGDCLYAEEARFFSTLDSGYQLLNQIIPGIKDGCIPGDVVFKLYDTYGFPIDLIQDIAQEKELKIDREGFEVNMNQQQTRSRQTKQFTPHTALDMSALAPTDFMGYAQQYLKATVIGLFGESGQACNAVSAEEVAVVVVDKTPFYAESGGQVGDIGLIVADSGVFEVEDTQSQAGVHLHYGRLRQGSLAIDARVQMEVDAKRKDIVYHHSATHLLHAALREILGTHVIQKGSLVDATKLRFDFSHPKRVTPDEIHQIELLVNQRIRDNLPCKVEEMLLDDALSKGAMALFDENYGDTVRMVSMDDFSVELCGGTHVSRTGDIGLFKIVSEGAVAAGIRRIEAVAGSCAMQMVLSQLATLQAAASHLQVADVDIPRKLQEMSKQIATLTKHSQVVDQAKQSKLAEQLLAKAYQGKNGQVVCAIVDANSVADLRQIYDQIRSRCQAACVVLAGSEEEGKGPILVGVFPESLTQVYHARDIMTLLSEYLLGKGGGRSVMAQGSFGSLARWHEVVDMIQKMAT